IEYVNSAFERMTGYAAAEMIGRSPRAMHGQDGEQPGLVELRRLLHEKCEGHAVIRNYRKDGTPYWSDIYLAPVPDEQGEVRHFVAAKYDITETRKYEAELEFQSNYDVLTGLANRNLLRDRLGQAIAFAARQNSPVWVMYLNLDRFKLVNETFGFAAGDALLAQVGARLKAAVRDTDTVARLSGDDFVLVLPERSDDMAASAAVQRLLQAVGQALNIDGHEFVPACSVGVAVHPADGADPDTLIRHAHIAMYRAKEAGSNSFRFYAPSMNERIVERMQLEGDLRNALERGELELHYQPQVELRSGRVIGMEALLRWRHPRLGMVAPAHFVGLAEESGLIVPIGEWVLRAACAQNREWQRAGLGGLRVGVNLSARQFRQKDLGQAIARILEETGLAPQYLDIELTESLVMADVEHAVAVLSALKALGVRVLVDDFGTGYSSLAYLKRFPIDVLKIDRSFVEDIVSDPDDAAIVRSVISLAHSLRLEVIAEGVETDAQLTFLQRHGCDQMQGYLFSRPLPPAQFRELLMQGRSLPALEEEAAPQQTLLVVDDDAHVISSLCRLLRQDGYRILCAGSAAEAFDLLARQPAHVILCDQRMPVMEGTEFLSKVKDLYPDTIRIILSGYTDLQCVIDAINCGSVYRFFTKPWDDQQLRDNIRAAFRQYWLQHRAAGDERMPVS
ncbi:MAG TPA: EAL domain-containing protein, partial [Noviherbaspirillum sp.]|nr:EAL domain-containing protein [Noviherbaspirillum sp.]